MVVTRGAAIARRARGLVPKSQVNSEKVKSTRDNEARRAGISPFFMTNYRKNTYFELCTRAQTIHSHTDIVCEQRVDLAVMNQ